MYVAFIHIGRYDIKARRHLACVQNGITQLGDWRMETCQLALRARCHVSIRQSPSLCNAILNTHAFSLYDSPAHCRVSSLMLRWSSDSKTLGSMSIRPCSLLSERMISTTLTRIGGVTWRIRADSMFVPSQWETSLQSNAVSHWLGANLESVFLGSSSW